MDNAKTSYYAFFDVDGTLIKGQPMMDFLRFYYHARFSYVKCIGELIYRLYNCKFKLYSLLGIDRKTINESYYRCYKNQNINWIKTIGELWFSNLHAKSNCYLQRVIDELKIHQSKGAEIVFVSGSFFACLASFAQKLGVKHVLATSLELNGNKLTGEVLRPQTIGTGKVEAIQRFLKQHHFNDYNRCYAYGDHSSDIPMLSLVGHPVVIGGDKSLEEHASKKCWKVIYPTP